MTPEEYLKQWAFAYACADAEPFKYEDAEALWEIAKRDGWLGLVRWVAERRKEKNESPFEPLPPFKAQVNRLSELEAELAACREQLEGLRAAIPPGSIVVSREEWAKIQADTLSSNPATGNSEGREG